ncbi:hypothetical protein [Salinivibrio sp. YCSC6]|uniref:hypothetical protein n=1 Tax=Salinivibrio sp. YCSC6 TaxID=2003370 RepID=UPI000BBB7E4A|nr:hypothetical protein [Salinivibrio sp. YCSC6]PCE67523.1 hypothetical protein B6G00_04020 [Salinivibrio sp. YCSC6]QCF35570.1 hypothetical protein E8E00_04930 [Salinivibrio sp. YCSC6]
MTKKKVDKLERQPLVMSKEKRLELIAESLENIDFTDSRKKSVTAVESIRRMRNSFSALVDAH